MSGSWFAIFYINTQTRFGHKPRKWQPFGAITQCYKAMFMTCKWSTPALMLPVQQEKFKKGTVRGAPCGQLKILWLQRRRHVLQRHSGHSQAARHVPLAVAVHNCATSPFFPHLPRKSAPIDCHTMTCKGQMICCVCPLCCSEACLSLHRHILLAVREAHNGP